MSLQDIPQQLRELPQWVCVYGDSKVPMTALSNQAASSTDSKSWSSFQDAIESVKKGYHDNIGFVFADNELVGIDIDDGFDEDGFLSETAADIIGKCRSYTERSRSGRGFHILLKGNLPFKGKNNLRGVEMYRTGRYFIMTGDVFRNAELIEDQDAIDYVVEKYFPEIEKESGRKSAFEPRVYNPTWPKWDGASIPLKPTYPRVTKGGRNLSLASLAGMLHTAGFSRAYVMRELMRCNSEACSPPLDKCEIRQIVSSITRYSR